MTIAASEQAIQSSDKYECYDFLYGTDHYLYTSDFKTHDTYVAETIERTGFPYSSDLSQRVCTINIPSTNALALLIKVTNETKPLQVTIDLYFSDDPTNHENVFVGRATGVNFAGGVCTIEFKSIMQEIERNICRVRMQALCNNQLFDAICGNVTDGIDPDDFEETAEVTVSVDGKTLSSATFGTLETDHGLNYLSGGKVLFDGMYRLITSHDGNNITIQYEYSDLVTTDEVTVWPGCNKSPAVCISKYNNLVNFVGMPYIPLKDSEQVALTHG